MKNSYNLAIIGGGLAGLSLAILQAKAGKKVVLFEKKQYPFHRVCGEYISMESWDFVEQLGLNLSALNLPIINKLIVTDTNGGQLKSDLDLGGFGISRYNLDFELSKIAKNLGVHLLENTTVLNAQQKEDIFEIKTNHQNYFAQNCTGAFGKRSNLDISWNRNFISKHKASLNQYVGIKYHIQYPFAKDTIALHNFKDGYCGISAIENNQYCLCYLTKASNLKKADNDIAKMQNIILSQNPFLKDIFTNARFIWDKPEVISNISFEAKEQKINGISLIGDAAGLITPLCGNGMSMAFHSALLVHQSLLNQHSNTYQTNWNNHFKTRLQVGRYIQSMFGNTQLTSLFLTILKPFSNLQKWLIRQTHGSRF